MRECTLVQRQTNYRAHQIHTIITLTDVRKT